MKTIVNLENLGLEFYGYKFCGKGIEIGPKKTKSAPSSHLKI